jgi:hypothetical protein
VIEVDEEVVVAWMKLVDFLMSSSQFRPKSAERMQSSLKDASIEQSSISRDL